MVMLYTTSYEHVALLFLAFYNFVVLFYIMSLFSEHNLLSICCNLFFFQKILG
jgi:hypothetical protein